VIGDLGIEGQERADAAVAALEVDEDKNPTI
jgi:hypothetical protein